MKTGICCTLEFDLSSQIRVLTVLQTLTKGIRTHLARASQVSGLNKLAGAVFGTITFSDEGTVWIATGVLVKGSPSI